MPLLRTTLWTSLLAAALSLTAVRAHAQAVPSTDRSFTVRSADNDPDLIVVRETYDSATRTQSLYLRVYDGTPDRQAFSGRLNVRGAEVVRIISDGGELAASDALWGIAGVAYGGAAPGRGLEGADPGSYTPIPGDPNDAVRIESPRRARFYLGTDADIDDLRILIRYPPEPGPTSFDVQLFYSGDPGRADPLGWPLTSQGGIQVGSLVDAIPDDGDYSEVFEIRNIKLLIEDLDIVEASVEVGTVPPAGGQAGPATFTVDNFANDTDLDQDNGFDQNGLISPIPAGSDLEHVVFVTPDLVNAATGELIPRDAVMVLDPPGRLVVGEAIPVSVQVQVPPDLSSGAYVGRLEVFEDNNSDGVRNPGEPFDRVNLTVIVGERPDGGFDLGLPDLGAPDVAPVDFGLPPTDAVPMFDLLDRGPGTDAQETDARGTDAQETDARGADAQEADARGTADFARPDDGPALRDAGGHEIGTEDALRDVAMGDAVTPRDGPSVRDLGPQTDANGDVGPITDALAGGLIDQGRTPGRVDFGHPRGGAFNCSGSPGPIPPFPMLGAGLGVLLLAVAWRRRP